MEEKKFYNIKTFSYIIDDSCIDYNIYEEELEYIYTRFLLCSSLRRMTKIKNKSIKKELLKRTWENLNIKFPDWKKNKYLKNEKTMKNLYIRTVNNFTYKIYIKLFSFI